MSRVAEECRCNIGQFFTQFERNTMSRVLLWPSNVAAGTPQKLNRRDIENQKRWDKLRTRTAVKGDRIQVLCVGRAGGTGFDAGMFEDDKTVFVVGEGKGLLMPKLDRQCLGLKLNETRKFLLKPGEEGHPQSERDESLVIQVPLGDSNVNVGATVRINHEGQLRLAMVADLSNGMVTLDMNDPLAGKVLHYEVTLLSFDMEVDRIKQLFPDPVFVPDRIFELDELKKFNGRNKMPIYIGKL